MTSNGSPEIVVLVASHVRNWMQQAAIRVYDAGLQPAVIIGCIDCDPSVIGGPVATGVNVLSADAIRAAAESFGATQGIVCWEDSIIVNCAIAAEDLGVGNGGLQGLATARNKHATRTALARHGMANARFALVSNENDCLAAAESIGFPAILKPVNGSGSALVSRVDSATELDARLSYSRAHGSVTLGGSLTTAIDDVDGATIFPHETFLLEQFLDGVEIDLELVIRDDLVDVCQVSEVVFQEDAFMETAFISPPISAPSTTLAEIEDTARGVASALGLTQTTANMTFRLTSFSGPVLVEVNAGRPGGHMLAPMAWYTRGVDLLAENIALAAHLPAPTRDEPSVAQIAALTLYPETTGILEGAAGRDAVLAHPQVIAVSELQGRGRPYPSEDAPYPLTVLVTGFAGLDDLEKLRVRLTHAARFIVS